MSKIRSVALVLAIMAVLTLALPSFSADEVISPEQAKVLRDKAVNYEKGNNSYLAWDMLTRYSRMTDALLEQGLAKTSEADLARAWRDALEYSPELYLGEESRHGVFAGSDGVFAEGSSAVKLNVPFGVYVEDFYSSIPAVKGDILVLVSLEVSNENTLRQIAFGQKDDYIKECMKQASRIEGRVCISFCPAVNTMRYTFTLAQSFKGAFARVSELCHRYAPDADMVYTLGDVRRPGWNTVGEFYPGDEYVDVFGVELCHTYVKSAKADPEAAYDSRGEYGDPIVSVMNMERDLRGVTDKEMPLIITGSSFPWGGTAALEDWAEVMERFYTLAPAAFPNLLGVLYSNRSSSKGYCNLRQNPDALQLYKKCLALPWYVKNGGAYTATPAEELTAVTIGENVPTAVYTGGIYRGLGYDLYLDSVRIGDACSGVTFTRGEHLLEAYSTDDKRVAKLSYKVTVGADGSFDAVKNEAEFDFNRNGIMDFGDVEMLNGYIAKWSIDLDGFVTDVNGDGKTNLSDASVLRAKMSPPDAQ